MDMFYLAMVFFSLLSHVSSESTAYASSSEEVSWQMQAEKVLKEAEEALGKPVRFTVESKKHMHSGCKQACHPSPVESKCVTACETAMYACIDHTGPSETSKDTKSCQADVLKKYTELQGSGKKHDEAQSKKKSKAFLQVERNGVATSDKSGAARTARLEREADETMSSWVEELSKNSLPDHYHGSSEDTAFSFLQIKRNIDDDNAQAAEMARMEDQADKIMGEDQDDYGKSDDSEDSKEPGTDAFLQIKRNIDDDNAQAAEMARMEDQADKIMGEDQDESSQRDDSEDSKEPGTDAFLQIKRNIDDDNAQAAEMARMEDQADKIMGEDQDDSSQRDDSEDSKEPGADSFLQIQRNIDDDNAQAAEMARMEDQADKIMGEDQDESSKSDDSDDKEEQSAE